MNSTAKKDPVIVAITGASGAAYALQLIRHLVKADVPQHILLSNAARIVLKQEVELELPEDANETAAALSTHLDVSASMIHCYGLADWFSPVASGSAGIKKMVIVPCSMGTLGRVAVGISDNLIERAADVILKEGRQLILVPRETPLSTIHLENMLKLSRMGASIIPAMPGFYHRPHSLEEIVDFMVDRVLDHLNIPNVDGKRWGVS